jgi:Flp pilus assembly protein TadG
MQCKIPTEKTHSQKGQSLVEMALVSLIFFFLLFGILEFGRALWTYNTIVQSTREAARWAVANAKVTSYDSGTGVYVIDSTDLTSVKNIAVYGYTTAGTPLAPGLTTSLVNVSIVAQDKDSAGAAINSKVSVAVSGYQFQFIVPIAPTITIPAYETSLYTEALGRVL